MARWGTGDLSVPIPDSCHYRRLSAGFSRAWPQAIAQRCEARWTRSGRRRTLDCGAERPGQTAIFVQVARPCRAGAPSAEPGGGCAAVARSGMADSLRCLAPEGRLVVVGFTGGEIPAVKVNRLLLGNTSVLGAASREFFEQQPATLAGLWGQLVKLRRAGTLPDPPVHPFAEAPRFRPLLDVELLVKMFGV